ncbi:MAG: GGDEF domain-containing protein [Betaproteobacteria bacterium]|nr:GGDEF domain-containing protein [Betaproteobacteria bacterium]
MSADPADAAQCNEHGHVEVPCGSTHAQGAPRHISLRTSLIMLVLVCILPGVALSTYLVYANYQLEKEKISRETELLAGQILVELDRELAAMESGLRVLATSDSLKNGDFQHFHQIARAALKSQMAYNYVLIDRQGRQVINTLRPYWATLPTGGNPPQLEEIFRSGKTVLTDLFAGPVTEKPTIALGVPVYNKAGEIIYTLNVGLQPDYLSALLKRQPLPEGWLAAIIDGSGTIVGRTREAERFVGHKVVPELQERLQSSRYGSMAVSSKEGVAVTTAYARSALWNWSVATGAPKSLIEGEMLRMFAGIGLVVLFFTIVGTWLAVRITRRVVSSVQYLNDAALALREGKPLALPKVQLHEAEAVGHAIVQASHLMAKVHHRAYHDPLTELGNRTLFYELVQHQLAVVDRENGNLAVLAIDLDNFKVVNDEEGHAAGDHLLESVARRIEATIRASDAAARMGGDEFAILLVDADQCSAEETAQRLVARLSEPYDCIQGCITASIGIAVYPTAGHDLGELLENADRALYAAKRSGRNTFCLASCRAQARAS